MKYNVFYSFQETGEELLDDDALEMDIPSAIKLLDKMTTEGDFLGLIDQEDNTFQIFYDKEEDDYWTEIPVPSRRGSYGTIFKREELESVMRGLKPILKVEDFPMFEFEEWDLDDEDEDFEEE